MILSWHSGTKRINEVMETWQHTPPRIILWDAFIPSSDPVVITAMIASHTMSKLYMDRGISVDIMY